MRCLIANHDAGGAEIVSSWVRRNIRHQYRFIVEGPACPVYQRKLPAWNNCGVDDLYPLLEETDFVLTGTSGLADLERSVIKAARQAGKRTAAFLDYWYCFRERFMLAGELCLPDELWVGDQYAFENAYRVFPDIYISHVENPYMLDVRDEAHKIRCTLGVKNKGEGYNILYLCQPYDQDYREADGDTIRVTDLAMLDYFFEELSIHLYKLPLYSVKIRLHPTENEEKYRSCSEKYKTLMPISFTKDASLVDECVVADYVVGTHTMGLVVALWSQARVFHCIPPRYRPCALPYKEIENFHAFLEQQ